MQTAKLSNEEAWENIFKRYQITDRVEKQGYVEISAEEIKAVDGKEARLMAKVDFRQNLPKVMQDAQLSILAVKNGLYKIAKNDPFIEIEEQITAEIMTIEPPKEFLSIDPFNIKSESAALDLAYLTKMCDEVFGEESFLTIRGRLRGDLSFELEGTHYEIEGVQIEVDGGYETKDAIHLIEAKIGFRDNINIRQLLYPQLYWQKQSRHSKEIKSYIFYLQDDIFRFIPYVYDGKVGYADHANEKVFRFRENGTKFSLKDVVVDESKIDTSIPFPQANKFAKVQEMLFVIAQNECLSKQELLLEFDIVSRQIDYYLNVLKWMRLCTEQEECITLTKQAKEIVELPFKKRIEALAAIVLSEPIANNILHNKPLSQEMFTRYNMQSTSTQQRRVQTITAWINYFKKVLFCDTLF